MKNKLVKFIAIVLMSAPLASFAMPILDVDGSGQLLGASGVNVNGTLYDVQFMDGTCIALFNGCDSAEDFVFNTLSSANEAANALLAQVLLDTAVGLFDTMPDLTRGCEAALTCVVYTPFMAAGIFTNISVVSNDVFAGLDNVDPNSFFPPEFDTSLAADLTWAVWSATPSAVPEPNTALLALLGLFALRFSRRLNAK